MADLTSDELEAFIKDKMPGYKVAQRVTPQDWVSSQAEAMTPDIATLRKKYLGAGAAADVKKGGSGNPQESDTQLVVVEPLKRSHPSDPAASPKVVVISKSTRQITGTQR